MAHKTILAAVSRLANSSVWPSEHLSGEMGSDYLVACMLKVLRLGSSAGLSYYKQANAKLDGSL